MYAYLGVYELDQTKSSLENGILVDAASGKLSTEADMYSNEYLTVGRLFWLKDFPITELKKVFSEKNGKGQIYSSDHKFASDGAVALAEILQKRVHYKHFERGSMWMEATSLKGIAIPSKSF